MGTDALDTYAHDTRCPAYGKPEWADVDVCGPCDYVAQAEPPTDVACPDCRAESGVPCHIDCSSRWT